MRREQLTVRAVGFSVLFGAAVVLSGCVTTVDGSAAAGHTIAPISTVMTHPDSPPTMPTSAATVEFDTMSGNPAGWFVVAH